jgi:hypothetical protein
MALSENDESILASVRSEIAQSRGYLEPLSHAAPDVFHPIDAGDIAIGTTRADVLKHIDAIMSSILKNWEAVRKMLIAERRPPSAE